MKSGFALVILAVLSAFPLLGADWRLPDHEARVPVRISGDI